MEIAIGIILILASIFLIIAVLMQEGKSRNLSGAIGGTSSSDTFLGKSGSTSLDKKLSRLTTIVAIVFVVLVVVMYLMQDTSNYSGVADTVDTAEVVDTVDTAEGAAESDNASVDGTTAAAEG